MAVKLSEGALEVIMTGGNYDSPVLQILGSKVIAANNATERYRLLVSDGKYHSSCAIVTTQLNELVSSGKLCDFSVVRINRYNTSVYNLAEKDRWVMIILDLEVLKNGNEVRLRIGNPVSFEGTSGKSGQTNAQSAPAPAAAPAPAPAPQPKISAVSASTNSSIAAMNRVKMSPSVTNTIHPISSLSPYQNRWCIKARVTSKQPVRTYASARGEGRLFSVVFTDGSGEIKCTGFNSGVDKFSDLLQLNKVYLVSNCTIKPANKKFNQADYEMTFHDDSFVQPCEDDVALPSAVYNFTPISKLEEASVDSIVDVIGIAKQASDVQSLLARTTGKELKKREVTLVDQSGTSVALTLWGNDALQFDCSGNPVVAVKGARLSEFMGGKSLSVQMNSTLLRDPDIDEAHKLRGWWSSGGSGQEQTSISTKGGGGAGGASWTLLGDLASQGLGLGDKADYFSAVVSVLIAKSDNCIYKACPAEECRKKIMDLNNGSYRCEKCNREYNNFKYRMLLSVQVSDYSGGIWVTLFHEEAQKLLGVSADTIGRMLDEKDETYKEYFTDLNFKQYQMKFRTKMESYNDEKRLKTTVVSVDPVDYKAYSRRLLQDYKTTAGISTGR